jgi:hypothetical protein
VKELQNAAAQAVKTGQKKGVEDLKARCEWLLILI